MEINTGKLQRKLIKVLMPLIYFSTNYPLESKLYDFIIRCRKIMENLFTWFHSIFQNNIFVKVFFLETLLERAFLKEIVPRRIMHNIRNKLLGDQSSMEKSLTKLVSDVLYNGLIQDQCKMLYSSRVG
jgi:hypothetical protein